MTRWSLWLASTLLSAVCCETLCLAAPGLSPESDRSANEAATLVAELLSQKPPDDITVEGVLKFRDAKDKRSAIPVTYSIKRGPEGWHGTYETAPANGPRERLVVVHQYPRPNQYLHWPGAEAGQSLGEPKRLSGDQAAIPFAGTDFWIADLGLEFLHWPQQRLVKHRITMRSGRPCKVLESINPKPSATSYARVLSWIDREYGAVIYAEGYDSGGKLWKSFHVKAFRKEVPEMWILNDKKNTRTGLQLQWGETPAEP